MRSMVEGACRARTVCRVAPSVTPPAAARHLPRFAGEER